MLSFIYFKVYDIIANCFMFVYMSMLLIVLYIEVSLFLSIGYDLLEFFVLFLFFSCNVYTQIKNNNIMKIFSSFSLPLVSCFVCSVFISSGTKKCPQKHNCMKILYMIYLKNYNSC